jgi:hypothetical protein
MKTGTKYRLKYMPEDKQDCIIDVVDGNLAYIRFLNFGNTHYSFPVPLSELEEIKEWPKTWEELGLIHGHYIGKYSNIYTDGPSLEKNKNIFATQQQAESALAFAQLSQLHKQIVGDWVPDWGRAIIKWCVCRSENDIVINDFHFTFNHLAFQTRKQAEFSLEHHRSLWEKYWML